MIGVVAKIPVQEGKMDDVLAVFKDYITHVAQEEGTLSYTLNTDKNDPNMLVILERYTDKEALGVHSGSQQFQEMFGKLGSLVSGQPEITIYREILSK